VQTVTIGDVFDLPEEEKRALAFSNALDDWATANWREVTLSTSLPHRIAGWGSFEHPDLHGDLTGAGDIVACAVFASSLDENGSLG